MNQKIECIIFTTKYRKQQTSWIQSSTVVSSELFLFYPPTHPLPPPDNMKRRIVKDPLSIQHAIKKKKSKQYKHITLLSYTHPPAQEVLWFYKSIEKKKQKPKRFLLKKSLKIKLRIIPTKHIHNLTGLHIKIFSNRTEIKMCKVTRIITFPTTQPIMRTIHRRRM